MENNDINRVTKKKTKLKKGIIQNLFCIISILFIIGCCVFYGKRLVKYYKIYNPKVSKGDTTVYMASEILSKTPYVTEGNGAYRISGNVVYKGEKVDNYVEFSNQLWRIIKVRNDNSIEMILDDYINIMEWDSKFNTYKKSDIYDYLNEYYINSLNKNLLTLSSTCTDDVISKDSITCEKLTIDNYVNLLDINSFLNSIQGGTTFISNENEKIWLLNRNSENKKIWNTNGSSITLSDYTSKYFVKPVITLSSQTILESGEGTEEKPYVVKEENKEIKIGSYVKLDEDLYRVFDIEKNIIKLESNKLIQQNKVFGQTNLFDTSKNNTLAYYLNNTYMDTLSYKDKLVEADWYNGEINNSYKDVKESSTKAYISIPNRSDIKFNSKLLNYYLLTPTNDKLYIYNTILAESKVTVARPFRTAIAISSKEKFKGNGTLEEPFELEV